MNGTGGRAAAGSAPPELMTWMRRHGDPDGDLETLVRAAMDALDDAIKRGSDRSAAFALLAADGLLTRAVERLAGSSDPESELLKLVETVSAERAGDRC